MIATNKIHISITKLLQDLLKIAAGICEFGDPEGLYRCLGSLQLGYDGGIDVAIIIHGQFKYFNLHDPQAFEKTQAVVSRFPKGTVELVNDVSPGKTEIESRNLYNEIAGKLNCDWLLVIDSDEYLASKVTDFKEFRRQLQFVMDVQVDFPPEQRHQIFDIELEGNIPAFRGPQPRLFLHPESVKYWGKHNWWVLEKTKYVYKGQSDAARIIGGIYLLHDHTIRDSKYYTASIGYKEWQSAHEGEEVITEEKMIERKKL